MSTTTPSVSDAATSPAARRPWEAPVLSALSLHAQTGHEAVDEADAPPPPLPEATASKPGLSWEFSFPMAVKSGS
jgi:hypothetical protein